MQISGGGNLFLNLPGELRNRIYNYVVDCKQCRILRKPVRIHPRPAEHSRITHLWRSGYGLTQICHAIRSEFLPKYRVATSDNVLPQDLYEYINAFVRVRGRSDDSIAGSVIIDFSANVSSTLDIKPLLKILRRAKRFHVGTYDIIQLQHLQPSDQTSIPDMRDILSELYDIIDLEPFYDYVENTMIMLEVECDETKGVEIVFELGMDSWEDWMGVWSRPQDDPESRVGIPLEIAEDVVQWGTRCGMNLNRAEGSHLTVNFRRQPQTSALSNTSPG